MDHYTIHQELEALAGNADTVGPQDDGVSSELISRTIDRWHTLFGISKSDAVDRIMEHRNNLTRTRVSDAHWDAVETEKIAAGCDREAYEYELELQKKKAFLPDLLPSSDDASTVTYLVELSGPLDSPEKVRHAVKMAEMPAVVEGWSVQEGRAVSLCCIDVAAKSALLRWAAGEGGGFEPTVLVNPKSLE